MFDERRDGESGEGAVVTSHVGRGWREIDRQMRRLAKRRAALDAEEAPVLLAAMRAEVHVHLGYGTFAEYLERVCGFTPHTARERMRVAEALEGLPVLREALADGEVAFSALRELTRIVTPETEEEWLAAIGGCTVREIEDELRGRKAGDRPGDRPDPAIEPRRVKLEMTPETYALFLEARRALEREAGEPTTDDAFMADACRRVLADSAARSTVDSRAPTATADDRGATATADDRGPTATADACGSTMTADGRAMSRPGRKPSRSNRPAHTIAVTVCRDCGRGWQEAGSKSIELSPAALDRARCDALELGNVDSAAPAKATRTIPAPIRRAVLARDHHRCTVPGCRSSQFVDVHHLKPRAAGGPHVLTNLITLCSRHHSSAHHGRIAISGVPGALLITHADGRPYGTDADRPRTPRPSPPANLSRAARSRTPRPSPANTTPADRTTALSRTSRALVQRTSPTSSPTVATHQALVAMGVTRAEATRAITTATSHVGPDPTFEALVRAALDAFLRSRT